MKKRVIAMVLTGIMTVGLLVGCSTASSDSLSETASQTEQEQVTESASTEVESTESESDLETASSESETEAEAEGKTLVVYYSATGNTKETASMIANATGGSLFELVPVDPYTSEELNYSDDNSRVSIEYKNEDQRNVELVSTTVDDWDSISKVYIGYPIWWGQAAWPVNSFITSNDFTEKTVIPFCTSASSSLGRSGELLAEMAGTGDWLGGMRFNSTVSEEEIQAWVDGLGL